MEELFPCKGKMKIITQVSKPLEKYLSKQVILKIQ